jgi:polygalacturonase
MSQYVPPLDNTKEENMSDGFTQSGGHVAARTIEAKVKDRIDVRDFGAKGNGLDDDREAINNAIEYARATGKDVEFGKGTYRLFPAPWWWQLFRRIQKRLAYWWWFYRLPSR